MLEEIEHAKLLLNNILSEWDHFSTHLQNLTSEELEEDLFAQLDYLTQVEDANARVSAQLVELEEQLKKIHQFPNSSLATEQILQIAQLKTEFDQIQKSIKPKLQLAEESYNDMVEDVLRSSQDLINDLVDKFAEHPTRGVSLRERVGLELDGENKLRELQDSLGAYRECRLENMTEDSDPIIDQLDSQILACDGALQMDETNF